MTKSLQPLKQKCYSEKCYNHTRGGIRDSRLHMGLVNSI
jgi:hypothetical protein